MATIYWKAGDIKGECKSTDFEEWIDVESFNYSISRPSLGFKVGQKNSNEGDTVTFQPIMVTKSTDSSSVYLQEQAFKKGGIEMTFTFVSTDDGPAPYLEITLRDAIICSYSLNDSGTGMPTETIGISFNRIETKFTPTSDKGDEDSPLITSYDIVSQQLNA